MENDSATHRGGAHLQEPALVSITVPTGEAVFVHLARDDATRLVRGILRRDGNAQKGVAAVATPYLRHVCATMRSVPTR